MMLCIPLAIALACGEPVVCAGGGRGRVEWREAPSCDAVRVETRRPQRYVRYWRALARREAGETPKRVEW